MDTIKEKDLPKRLDDLSSSDYIRTVDAITGKSEDTAKSLFTWGQSQITGLTSSLAELTPKEAITALKSKIAYIKENGEAHGSGFTMGDVTSLTIDSILNGIHVASTPFTVDNVGTVIGVSAVGNVPTGETATGATPSTSVQTVITLNGTFCRTYSGGTWGNYMYIGGSTSNISLSRAEIIALMEDEKLTPSTSYRITDHPNYDLLVVRAVTGFSLDDEAVCVGYVPKVHTIRIHGGVVWLGAWRSDMAVSVNGYCHFYNRVYRNKLGAVGTASGFTLDSTNWELIDEANTDFYNRELHGCVYDIKRFDEVATAGFISKEWDGRGNIFGMPETQAGTYLTRYNQFGDSMIYNNELSKCYNNTTETEDGIHDNYGGGKIYDTYLSGIYNNTTKGQIYNAKQCSVTNLTQTTNLCKAYNGNFATVTRVTQNNSSEIIFGDAASDEGGLLEDSTIDGIVNLRVNNADVTILRKVKIGILANVNITKADSSEINSSIFSGFITINNSFIGIGVTLAFDSITIEDSTLSNNSTLILSTGSVSNVFLANGVSFDASSLGYGSDLAIFNKVNRLELSAPVYKDVNAAIASGRVSGVNMPTWSTFQANTSAYTFAINDYIDLGTIEYPHECVVGGDVECHLHFATNGTDTTIRKVKFRLFYTYGLPDNGAYQFKPEAYFDAEATIAANTPSLSSYKLSMGTISDPNMKHGAQIKFRIKRIAGTGTEPTGNPFLGQVGTHCLVDTLGSVSIESKF